MALVTYGHERRALQVDDCKEGDKVNVQLPNGEESWGVVSAKSTLICQAGNITAELTQAELDNNGYVILNRIGRLWSYATLSNATQLIGRSYSYFRDFLINNAERQDQVTASEMPTVRRAPKSNNMEATLTLIWKKMSTIDELKTEVSSMRRQNKELTDEVSSLREDNKELKEEVKTMNEKLSAVEKQNEELKTKMTNANEKLSAVEKQNEELKTKLSAMEKQNEELRRKNNDGNGRLAKVALGTTVGGAVGAGAVVAAGAVAVKGGIMGAPFGPAGMAVGVTVGAVAGAAIAHKATANK